MKKLVNVKTTVTNGKITICADIEESAPNEFAFPVQQVTVGHLNPINPRWPRHCQISQDAYFIKCNGFGMAIFHDDLIAIAAQVEPKTSFPPVVKKLTDDLFAEVSSELNPDFQWQVSDDAYPQPTAPRTPPPQAVWSNIDGATSVKLDKTPLKTGQWVRCIISSEAGSVTSNPVKI